MSRKRNPQLARNVTSYIGEPPCRQLHDLRTGKPVIVIAEVAGLKLFVGLENKRITGKQVDRGASAIIRKTREHRVSPAGAALSLISLGHRILEKVSEGE